MALYDSTGGVGRWYNNSGWATDAPDMGSWYGVTVNYSTSVVIEVDLDNNLMTGIISPKIYTRGGGG